MAPPRKKRKTNNGEVEKFLCFTCDTERTSSQFPDYNPTSKCEHLINTCKTCLKKWVETTVNGGTFATDSKDTTVFGVKCPQCDEVMKNMDIEMAATKKVHTRFEELERKHIGDTTPGWRWCLAPGCRAGQVHESKVITAPPPPPPPPTKKKGGKQAKSKTEPKVDVKTDDEENICTCHECGAKACVTCDRPWHAGETCSAYQARIKDRIEEEDKALQRIQTKTRGCPNPRCGRRIEKNGGCPMMNCTGCHSVFCWTCMEVIQAGGACKCQRDRMPADMLAMLPPPAN